MPIIRPAGNGRELVMAAWGLVPYWLKPEQLGEQAYSTINARRDRVQTAPTYRDGECRCYTTSCPAARRLQAYR
jgi:putative SOS response-associated peptidase YedK